MKKGTFPVAILGSAVGMLIAAHLAPGSDPVSQAVAAPAEQAPRQTRDSEPALVAGVSEQAAPALPPFAPARLQPAVLERGQAATQPVQIAWRGAENEALTSLTAEAGAEPDLAPLSVAHRPDQTIDSSGVMARKVERLDSVGRQTIEIKSGDTLAGILTGFGIATPEAHKVIAALKTVYNPRHLRPGQSLTLRLAPPSRLANAQDGAERSALLALRFNDGVTRTISVTRTDQGDFKAETADRILKSDLVLAEGRIDSSLFVDGSAAGAPARVLAETIRIFSYDVDFQREVHKGDRFSLLYESLYDPKNRKIVQSGNVLYAEMTVRGKPMRVYRFSPDGDQAEYFDSEGRNIRKALLRTPIDGARISSRYGMRKHPILGYSRMHTGIDFAAPTGTPILAAGDGVVQRIGRNGGYGNYIRLHHNDTYDTAYAHLSRYAKGMKKGSKVRQGDVIGYVGSTGRSTGPHLHYEILRDGKHVDPSKVKMPTRTRLAGKDLKAFELAKAEIDAEIELRRSMQGLTTEIAAAE